jgi:predicted DNA-binding protein (MmcQ/YjbR family)
MPGRPDTFAPAELDELCRSFPGAVPEHPFGPETTVYKVSGKLFALVALAAEPPLRINLKCEPLLAEQLRADHPATILPGYHMNKRHWNTVVLDGSLARDFVVELVEDSYDLVVEGLPAARRPGASP